MALTQANHPPGFPGRFNCQASGAPKADDTEEAETEHGRGHLVHGRITGDRGQQNKDDDE